MQHVYFIYVLLYPPLNQIDADCSYYYVYVSVFDYCLLLQKDTRAALHETIFSITGENSICDF